MEKSRTFVSYQPRYPVPSGEDYRQIRNAQGKVEFLGLLEFLFLEIIQDTVDETTGFGGC